MLRQLATAALVTLSAACYTVQPVAAPQQFIPEQAPQRVWVIDSSTSETFLIENPSIRGDTVFGRLGGTSETMALAIDANRRVFAKQKSSRQTTSLVAGLGLLGGLAVYTAANAGTSPRACGQPGLRGCPPQ